MARASQRTQDPAKKVGSPPPAPITRPPRTGDVAVRAYEIWQQSGCPHGRDQDHWFQAERELRARTH